MKVNRHGIRIIERRLSCKHKERYPSLADAQASVARNRMKNVSIYSCEFCKTRDGSPALHIGRDAPDVEVNECGRTLAAQLKHKFLRRKQ